MMGGRWGWFRIVALLFVMVPLVACGEEEEVATDREEVPEVTPDAADELPGSIETLSIEIEDGEFTTDEIIVQRGEPTELEVVNRDDEAYEFSILDLVTPQEIPAGETVVIGFTTPDPDVFTGELTDPDDGTVLSEIRVDVRGAGGAS